MQLSLWLVLLLSFVFGALAAYISQRAVAVKGLEAGAKAKTLSRNVDNLVERNAVRRENLKNRQKILDDYVNMNIKHQQGQFDLQALKQAIEEERKRIASFTESINKSEIAIIEARTRLADVEREKALSGWRLILSSVFIGGVTAGIFGFLGQLGLPGAPLSITGDVPLTSNVVVQSLALGAGWPLVWEKFFSEENLESAASAAAAQFDITIKEAEKEQV